MSFFRIDAASRFVRLCVRVGAVFSLLVATTVANAVDLSTDRPAFGDFYGNNSRQYEVTGSINATIPADAYADTSARNAAVADRLRAVEVYLSAVITDKYPDIFLNFDYGNYKATVRHETMRSTQLVALGGDSYRIDYSVVVGGPTDLITRIGSQFSFQMPANAVGSDFGFPLFEIRRFDPATETGPLETQTVTVTQMQQSPNTYPEYDRLLEDDTLDITMWAGYDYTEDRVDLWTAVRSWIALFEADFDVVGEDYADAVDPEVEREIRETMARYYPGSLTETTINLFSRMTLDTGPFSKTVSYKGRSITINVKILHRELYNGDNAAMKSAFLEEMRTQDIVIFNGHAGPYYAWYLGPEADAFLDVDAIANSTMDPNRYQVMVVSGCQTYSTYAEHFYRNPSKNTSNLDVITAVNWIQLSHGERSINNILSFFVTDFDDEYQVFSYGQILRGPNSDVFEPDSFWAVVGTNDNPVVNPVANVENFGQACSADTQCGNTPANRCTRGQCSVQALNDYVCPTGYDFIDPYAVWGAYCAPSSCPQFVFDNGQIYIDGGYADNQCSTDLTCPNIWFYGPDTYATAACESGEWVMQSSGGGSGSSGGTSSGGSSGSGSSSSSSSSGSGSSGGSGSSSSSGSTPVSCPNSVFGDGKMYDAGNNYVDNQCSSAGAECASVYFYAKAAYETGVCENGAWIDAESATGGGSSSSSSSGSGSSGSGSSSSGSGSSSGGGSSGGTASLCPNSVFDNGFMYDATPTYVANSCSLEGQVCPNTYFYGISARADATCEGGVWVR